MKRIVTKSLIAIFYLIFTSGLIYSQNIYNSADVKLKAPLKQNWEYKTTETILNQITTKDYIFFNTVKEISAISTADGKLVWSYIFPKERGINSVVTFSEKYAVFTSYKYDDKSEKGTSSLTLVDLPSRKEKWSLKSNEIWYEEPAVITTNSIICLSGPPKDWKEIKKYYEMEFDDLYLTAFSLNDGKQLWKTEIDDKFSVLLSANDDYCFLSFDFDYADSGEPKNKLVCYSSKDGKLLWDYNPSGIIQKVMIGGIVCDKDVIYTHPPYGFNGQIAKVDVKSGEEKWNRSISGFRELFVNSSDIICSSSYWYGLKANSGDILYAKKLIHRSLFSGISLGSVLGNIFGKSIFGAILGTIGNIIEICTPFNNGELTFIPTQFMWTNLMGTDVVNDMGLYSIDVNKDEIQFIIMNKKDKDDNQIIYTFNQSTDDVFMANGCSPTNGFVTTGGKVYSINLSDGKSLWNKDFSGGSKATSLGLLIKDDKMYLFTSIGISQLINE